MSSVKNLFRDYGDFKIDIPSWEIADQGVTALIGPSGSGKTSVFRLLIGLEKAQSLKWIFGGEDLAKLPPARRRLGVVFQNYELFPHMTATENILFAAKARGLEKTEIERRFRHLTGRLKMAPFLERPASVLSGGEKQRTALVRALVGKPRLLLLDEPFSALDEELRVESRALVKDLILEEKVPALLVTHDRQDVAALADHSQNILDGKLVAAAIVVS